MIGSPSGILTARRDWSFVRRRAVPVAVVVCWLIWAALSWWTAPRAADRVELDHDLAAGRVVTWFRADGWVNEPGGWGQRPRPRYASEGEVVVWSHPDGQIRYASVGVPTRDVGLGGDPVDERLARAAGSHGGTAPVDRLTGAAGLLAVVLGLGWLVALVAGPAPVAGTRSYWFWVGLLPLGVGLLAWLHREWWRGDVPPSGPCRSGWVGFGWLVAGGLLLSVAVAGLRALLGDHVVPGW